MTNQNQFHSWLIRQRIYCEHGQCMSKATHVKNVHGRDEVRCDFHSYEPRKIQHETNVIQ